MYHIYILIDIDLFTIYLLTMQIFGNIDPNNNNVSLSINEHYSLLCLLDISVHKGLSTHLHYYVVYTKRIHIY